MSATYRELVFALAQLGDHQNRTGDETLTLRVLIYQSGN
jgi:hypothetical protein